MDVLAVYLERQTQIDEAVSRVLRSGWYLLGREVEAFEMEFASWLGTEHTVTAANGTDAVALALRALDVWPGDLVLTVSHTAVATIAAIELTGAVPVFVDVEPATFTMDP
jgi:dTDP-4-amino-4,6-dideoxygalactose transaminase